MTMPASIPIVAVLSALPVIVACALLDATEPRAATCTADPSNCDPYVVTFDQVGSDVVATGSGANHSPWWLGLSRAHRRARRWTRHRHRGEQ
jgi:hypothetical protein